MDSHTLEVLDFPRVMEMLGDMCMTEIGRTRALSLLPSNDRAEVASEMDRLAEVISLANVPELSGIRDINGLLGRAAAGSILNPSELLVVKLTCRGFRQAHNCLSQEPVRLELLYDIFDSLDVNSLIEEEIERAIDDSAAVRDAASPVLLFVREELRRKRNVLVERMERTIENNPEWFEGGVVVRGERFVVPVRLEERNRIKGVVHASSGSGHTLFVEPIETVTEQNELQELRDAEREEVQRILRHLTTLVARHADELSEALEASGRLDLLLAKRRFAFKFDCTRPAISEGIDIELLQARHPLLLARGVTVVPLTFRLPMDTNTVVISGPNAGGKTVVLKTIGLFSLLMACGFFLPVGEGTRLPLFGQVFADIGDEQSLDNDLSSFTAHLVRIREMLDRAVSGDLVLLDEVGASTDPEEGAALAAAVLETLRDRGTLTIASTHLGALKLFAQDEPRMSNAAVEFKNGPTYRLVMGAQGESSALVIAERVGLQNDLVARARRRMGTDWLDMKSKLEALNAELERACESRAATERAQQAAERLRHEYEQKVNEFERLVADERRRLRFEQSRLLREARREIENLVRRIREQQADRESVVSAKRYVESGLAQTESDEDVPASDLKRVLSPGDTVESATFHRRGTVVELIDGEALVGFGQVRVRVPTSDLAVVRADDRRESMIAAKEYCFETRLDVRGMTREEAVSAVRRFLDDAVAAGVVELTLIHGKGTGVLRQVLWESLRSDTRVEQLRLGQETEGGSGVTFVRLKGSA